MPQPKQLSIAEAKPISQQDFIANCICSESENYYFILHLKDELQIGNYRIPKKTVNNESDAIIDAYEWYIDMNFSDEAKFQKEISLQVNNELVLPTDQEVKKWFEENIGIKNSCSASSAIYKFRLWIKDRSASNANQREGEVLSEEIQFNIFKNVRAKQYNFKESIFNGGWEYDWKNFIKLLNEEGYVIAKLVYTPLPIASAFNHCRKCGNIKFAEAFTPMGSKICACPIASADEKERFKMPTDKQIIDIAILFSQDNGVINKIELTNIVSAAQFILDRLFENNDVMKPSTKEA